MAEPRRPRKVAKSAVAQRDSPAAGASNSVVGEAIPGADRAKPGRKGRRPATAGPAEGAGGRLRAELTREGDPFSVTMMITMAARHADRLEVIDRLLSGDQAAWREVTINGQVAELRVTNLAVEERQRSAALHKILVDIGRMRGEVANPAPSGGKAVASPVARIQKARNA